jgi:hypothetical protein
MSSERDVLDGSLKLLVAAAGTCEPALQRLHCWQQYGLSTWSQAFNCHCDLWALEGWI